MHRVRCLDQQGVTGFERVAEDVGGLIGLGEPTGLRVACFPGRFDHVAGALSDSDEPIAALRGVDAQLPVGCLFLGAELEHVAEEGDPARSAFLEQV